MADPTSVVQAQIFHKLKQRFTHVPDEHIREVMHKVSVMHVQVVVQVVMVCVSDSVFVKGQSTRLSHYTS